MATTSSWSMCDVAADAPASCSSLCRWPVSGRRRRFPPAAPTTQRTRSNPCWTGPTAASCPKERRASNRRTRLVGRHFASRPNEPQLLCVQRRDLFVFPQTVTRWTTRSSTCPCLSISPARSGPESASVRTRPAPRSPTAEVEVKGHTHCTQNTQGAVSAGGLCSGSLEGKSVLFFLISE